MHVISLIAFAKGINIIAASGSIILSCFISIHGFGRLSSYLYSSLPLDPLQR